MGHGLVSAREAAGVLRASIAGSHKLNAVAAIRIPTAEGAFPEDILLRPPPVVVDANILRNDIRRACRTGRTVLITAANAGLIRLFCAEHVHDEVFEHSGDWTAKGKVTQEAFLHMWMTDYLPVIRVVSIGKEHQAWLDPAERSRIQDLDQPEPIGDPDDVPSAVLSLLLGAFFLSEDHKPLRAVYGDADLSRHTEWVRILKAAGDVGELSKSFTLAGNLAAMAGQGLLSGARKAAAATSPWFLAAVGLGTAWWLLSRPDSVKRQIASGAGSVLSSVATAAVGFQVIKAEFTAAAAKTPSWATLAASVAPAAVLGRACLHTLARSPQVNRSAAELRAELPYLGVAQGETKVRQVLRTGGAFSEVRRGRWQVGGVAPTLLSYLSRPSASLLPGGS